MRNQLVSVARKFLLGLFMGLAGLTPGISSGTVAVIAGVYSDIIEAMSLVSRRRAPKKQAALFLINIITGVVAAAFMFARFIDQLIELYPDEANLFFIGLIFGTLPVLYRRASVQPVRLISVVPLLVSLSLVLLLGHVQPDLADPKTSFTPETLLMLFLSGFVSSGAGLIPGISGSMVLVLIGMYATMIAAIRSFNLPLLLALGLGAFTGFVIFTRGIALLLKKHGQLAYSAIIGLFLGSAINLWPGLPDQTVLYLSNTLILMVGFLLAFLCHLLGKEKAA